MWLYLELSLSYSRLTLGLKLSVGWICSCCARGVPHGWYNLKHSLQKLALQSAQPLVASRVWGGLQNWHITATLPRLTVCLYLVKTEMIQCESIDQLQHVRCFLEVAVGVGQVITTFWLSAPSDLFPEAWSKYPHDYKKTLLAHHDQPALNLIKFKPIVKVNEIILTIIYIIILLHILYIIH